MSKLLAVFGNPVLHSKSPQLFNTAFATLGIEAYYTRINPVAPKNLVPTFRALGLFGANITAPFKTDVMPQLDTLSAQARAIGAVNTIAICNGLLMGYNTDAYGVAESLREGGVELSNAKSLLLGAGGAARAAACALRDKGAQVYICNRTHAKAQEIAKDFGCEVLDWDKFPQSMEFDVAVSTLMPEVQPPFLGRLRIKALLDANYKPSMVSDFARGKSVNVVPGERWLLHQAVEAFGLIMGQSIEPDVMAKGLTEKISRSSAKTLIVNEQNLKAAGSKPYDLLVPALWDEFKTVENLVDEEICKAFGG